MISTCPYCHQSMELGVIHKDRYHLKWIPKENDKGVMLSLLVKGIKVTNRDRPHLEVYYCQACKKMIFESV